MVLSEFEQLILLALVRLGDDAYGVTIRHEISERSGRAVSVAAVYAALDRLERAGFAASRMSDPTPVRGGRARRYYGLTREGAVALAEARKVLTRMWEGLDAHPMFASRHG